MARLSNCPECSKQVAVGPLAQAADVIACPHCEKEFPPSKLTSEDVPEVVVVTPGELPAAVGPEITAPRVRHSEPARRKQGSALRSFLGILLGGVVGLALGYYALLWIGGPNRDFLKVAPHLPVWLLPEAFQPIDLDDVQVPPVEDAPEQKPDPAEPEPSPEQTLEDVSIDDDAPQEDPGPFELSDEQAGPSGWQLDLLEHGWGQSFKNADETVELLLQYSQPGAGEPALLKFSFGGRGDTVALLIESVALPHINAAVLDSYRDAQEAVTQLLNHFARGEIKRSLLPPWTNLLDAEKHDRPPAVLLVGEVIGDYQKENLSGLMLRIDAGGSTITTPVIFPEPPQEFAEPTRVAVAGVVLQPASDYFINLRERDKKLPGAPRRLVWSPVPPVALESGR